MRGRHSMTAVMPASSAREAGRRPECACELPIGYLDDDGQVHRQGAMRLARARDEIAPLRDPRVRDNEAYLTILLLARTITRLGTLTSINAGVVENMFTPDLAFLQELYRRVNSEGRTTATVTCPTCRDSFDVDLAGESPGGS